MKEQFTDGFIFIKLGPQATDPNVKLAQLYHLLTGNNLKHSDINHAEQVIKQHTNEYYHNLLVIIDDVCHVEDAEPLVKAFSNYKTILTTRKNDIDKYIPSTKSLAVGPMTKNEAFHLLTTGVINSSQLSPEDMNLLNELAQDVYLWPLLLSLIRGQLFHYIKHYHLPYHGAILNVQGKLYDKGLTAFDKKNVESINEGHKLTVEACIEMTLELLSKSLSDKIKMFILFNGIGISLQTAVLHNLWNISKQEAEDVVDTLWAYGLVRFTNAAASPNLNSESYLEIHTVISHYIIEIMDFSEMLTLSPFDTTSNNLAAIWEGLLSCFRESYGVHDLSSLTTTEFLMYKQSEIENVELSQRIRDINSHTICEPHKINTILQNIQQILKRLPCDLTRIVIKELDSLKAECKRASNISHRLCRKLNQGMQRLLYEKEYDKLIPAIQEFMSINPLYNLAEKAITIVKKITPYVENKLLDFMNMSCEFLYLMTPDYHKITTLTIPCIKLNIEHIKQITSALTNGSPDSERTYHYFISNEWQEAYILLNVNRLIKLQKVAPFHVQNESSKLY